MKHLILYLINNKVVNTLIIINALIIFYLCFENLPFSRGLFYFDHVLSLFFLFELTCKIWLHRKRFFYNVWNWFDAFIILISIIPLMFHIFNIEIADLIANVTILRTFRLFKIFRTIRIIPNASKIYSDFKKAFKATYGIVIGGIVVLIIIGVVLCCIFKNFDPDNFGDPIVSIYTVFRLFSVEGWYEIPDAMSVRTSYWYANGIRVLFSFIVLLGIFLLGFIISSMSDELTMDNNDELIKKTTDLEGKIDELNRKIDLLVSKK